MKSRYSMNRNCSPAAAESAEGMSFCANRIMMILDAVILASIIIISVIISVRLHSVVVMVLGLMGALLVAGRADSKATEYGLSA